MSTGYTATHCAEEGLPRPYVGYLCFNPLEAAEEKVLLCFPFALSLWVTNVHGIRPSDITYLVADTVEALESEGFLPFSGAVDIPAGKPFAVRARDAKKLAVFTLTLKQTDVPAAP